MPYVRCGKCVYKGHICEDKGKKVGCSDSIEKAKKYLSKVRMETNESAMRITKHKLIQLIKEELEVILTNDEAKEMFDIDLKENSKLTEEYEKADTVAEPALQRPVWTKEQKEALLQLANNINTRFDSIEATLDQLTTQE